MNNQSVYNNLLSNTNTPYGDVWATQTEQAGEAISADISTTAALATTATTGAKNGCGCSDKTKPCACKKKRCAVFAIGLIAGVVITYFLTKGK